ncbi:hypothetical protein JQ609_09425 [Bradyrhizobium sp. AUGA SZCCT0169]|uniref:hypothetical protein n=1 Tax=Bradyrhizobium sp. AUGA SZCCT0169 TaxID=2807663 RepID=UPI001BAAD884|nr:hypothetical protein [Bradyrhizobium sp. AUGA SZCCT0169]MBR1247152.1 hypothetical protein [Bradyrhizobium sp. AUGA SZCCT0169]
MTRLVLTSSDSAGGCLLRAGVGDIVIPLGFRFVWDELPSDVKLEAMLGPGSLDQFPPHRLGEFHLKGMGALDLCERCEAVEFWFDPAPNAQLILVQLLDCLSSRERIVSKLTLFQADVDIAKQVPEAISEWKPPAVKIRNEHLEAASLAWQAYRQPTPQQWADLLQKEVSALPQLRQVVLELLEELPMPLTGLGATEMRMLELVAAGDATPFDVFPGHDKRNTRRVFGYWEVGELLDGLARGPAPAVAGLEEGTFTDEMHDDAARLARYRQSKLSLTPLGEAVLAQAEDFSRRNPIRRWWGGTELTNDNLWRWDPASRMLIAP